MHLQRVKSKKTLKKFIFCWHLEGQWLNEQDPELDPELDPDQLVRGTDPLHNVTDPEHYL
jgi:hypothetical protein